MSTDPAAGRVGPVDGSRRSTCVTPIVALDVPSVARALSIAAELDELCRFYKVGSELYTAVGPAAVQSLGERGASVFLDLKFHDIPNTVRGACRSAARLGVGLLTVHASGGRAMMEAAVEGARAGDAERNRAAAGERAAGACTVLAVTVLTSLDRDGLGEAWGRRSPGGASALRVVDEVVRLAGLARAAGVAGVVCGGAEAAAVRAAHGEALELLVPGVRLGESGSDDQRRVVTPAEAAAAGARYVVLGRTVTGASDPRAAMQRVIAELG